MNTHSNDLADQKAHENNFVENAGDDVIELTDMVEESPGGEAGLEADEADPISLDAEALEEEEIIELVDAVSDDAEAEEEVLDLTDVVEDDTFEPEAESMAGVAAEGESEEDFSEQGLVVDVGMALEQEAADVPGVKAQEEAAEPSIHMEEFARGEGAFDADETIEEVELVPEAAESRHISMGAADSDGEEAIRERFSDEKIEAIITRVVKETIEEKADRIVLEVAEAAIAKEIEKIKKAL